MTFYADPSFFALLALAVAGAAFLGLAGACAWVRRTA